MARTTIDHAQEEGSNQQFLNQEIKLSGSFGDGPVISKPRSTLWAQETPTRSCSAQPSRWSETSESQLPKAVFSEDATNNS